MLKTIARITVILVVIGLLAGGIYLIVQHNPSQSGLAGPQTASSENLGKNFGGFGDGTTGFRERQHEFDRGADFGHGMDFGRGMLGIVRTLLVFSVIIFMVVLIQKALGFVKSRLATRTGIS
jgi:hypothetical protein